MLKTRALRLVIALLVVVPFVDVGHASAEGPLRSVVGRQVSLQSNGETTDPTCPWSYANLPPAAAEARQQWQGVYESSAGQETLYFSTCWVNTSANGGDGFNAGDWTLARKGGTLSGTLVGGESSNIDYRVDLTVVSGTGKFEGTQGGKLYVWWCDRLGGGIRLTPKQNWRGCVSS